MSQFKFKGSSPSSTAAGQMLKEIDFGGQTVRIFKDSYTNRTGDTMYTIRVTGAGKDKRMGPQAALAIVNAGDEIAEYFREVGVIE
jgi:hypothetical protein